MTLAFDHWGRAGGRPLVFLHGWCGHRGQMKLLAKEFAADFQIFVPDLPGHGESSRLPIPTFDAYAAAISLFLEEQNLRNVVLIGHSMGGVLSVMVSGLSERVGAVVNLDGALPLTNAGRAGYRDFFSQVSREGFRQPTEAFIRRAFFLPCEYGPAMETLVSGMMDMPEDLGEALLKQFPTLNADHFLRDCTVPLLYVASAHPRFDGDAAKRLQPGIIISQVSQSGHFLQIFAVPQISTIIQAFLKGTC